MSNEIKRIKISLSKKNSVLLHEFAIHRSIKISTLVNQMLEKYLILESPTTKNNFFPISKKLLKLFLTNLNDLKIKKISHAIGKNISHDIQQVVNGTGTDNFLNLCTKWLEISNQKYILSFNNSYYQLVITHDLGIKWSMFLAIAIKTMFTKMIKKSIEYEISECTVRIVFDMDDVKNNL